MTYEYLCEACGHKWETEQRISEDPIKDCPHCGEPRAKRQISAGGGFILKGGGWYSDLYSSKAPAKADTSDASSSETKTDSSSTAVASAASDSASAASSAKKESSATPSAKGSGSSGSGSSTSS